MVTLTKVLDPQSPITTETPAELARQAVAKFRGQCNEDVYHALLGIIESESAKGAVGLSLYHCDDRKCDAVALRNRPTAYINDAAIVDINIASLVDTDKLVERLKADGFDVVVMSSDNFGTIIDIISWE
jgi:hypothetical protein